MVYITLLMAALHTTLLHDSGRERYIFFSFPHIAINSSGFVGSISRAGRPQDSCACGALNMVGSCSLLVACVALAVECQVPFILFCRKSFIFTLRLCARHVHVCVAGVGSA